MKKYLSYSEMYLWKRNRKEYIERYVDCIEQESNPQMELGKLLHNTFEEPRYPWVKEMRKMGYNKKKILAARKILTKMAFVNPTECEYMIRTSDHEPELFGIFDGFDRKEKVLYEFKTTEVPKRWTQWVVDHHPQIDFYAYMYYQIYHQYFNDIRLYVCDTIKGTVKEYHTARGPRDVELAGNEIMEVYNQMVREGIWEKRKSRQDLIQSKNLQLNI